MASGVPSSESGPAVTGAKPRGSVPGTSGRLLFRPTTRARGLVGGQGESVGAIDGTFTRSWRSSIVSAKVEKTMTLRRSASVRSVRDGRAASAAISASFASSAPPWGRRRGDGLLPRGARQEHQVGLDVGPRLGP